MAISFSPTPYPAVNDLLLRLKTEAHTILGGRFTGLYLYGSLALGDFDPRRSDIDFVVVTNGDLPDERVAALQAMHARLAAGSSPWATELEGSYIPLQALRRYDPESARHPNIERGGTLEVRQHDSDWVVQRYCLREQGVTVTGPPIATLIDPISPQDLRQAILDFMWWWRLQLEDTSRVERSGYQAYAVLTMCRILYTLQLGDIVSKPAAARWAQRNLDGRWAPLIERAWPGSRTSRWSAWTKRWPSSASRSSARIRDDRRWTKDDRRNGSDGKSWKHGTVKGYSRSRRVRAAAIHK